jgi:hypothetical protein
MAIEGVKMNLPSHRPDRRPHHCYSSHCPYYFDGTTSFRAIKPRHDKTLLEVEDINPISPETGIDYSKLM